MMVSRDLESSSASWSEREILLQMKVSLINVNVSSKMITSTQFLEFLLCLLSLNNNQPKIINMPEKHILEWYILLPFQKKSLILKHFVNCRTRDKIYWHVLIGQTYIEQFLSALI